MKRPYLTFLLTPALAIVGFAPAAHAQPSGLEKVAASALDNVEQLSPVGKSIGAGAALLLLLGATQIQRFKNIRQVNIRDFDC